MITIVIIFSYIFVIITLRLSLFNIRNYQKIFVIFSGILLLLLISIRSIYYGTDVIVYVNKFIRIENLNITYYFTKEFFTNEKDPVFYLFAKIISSLGFDYRGWLTILSMIFIALVFYIIYKYSNIPLLSILLLISLGYLSFSMSGLRQGIAISIIFFSYKYMKEQKLLKFVLLILIASLFHLSALIFLLAYLLSYLKFTFKFMNMLAIIFITYVLFLSRIKEILSFLIENEQYSYYIENSLGLNYTGFFIQLMILLFCLMFQNKIIQNNRKDVILYNLLYVGLLFQLFSTEVSEIFRISLYFSIFSILLIPNAIATIKDGYLKILVSLIIIILTCFNIFWSGSYNDFNLYWFD